MADRVSAAIRLGGMLSAAAFAELFELIGAERLSVEWDGAPFARNDLVEGDPLDLFAHEVAGGMFTELEQWCVEQAVPFVRWSGGYVGQWGPERVVFTGTGEPVSYAANEDDEIVVDCATVTRLGSLDAVLAHFAAAAFEVPPFVVTKAS